MKTRPYTDVLERMRGAQLRPTRQRMALAKLLFENESRHVTAETLHAEALGEGIQVSLATIYNTLHQFTGAGLMREVVVDPGKTYFDTNMTEHYHFYFPETGALVDIPEGDLDISKMPALPDGTEVGRMDVVIRLQNDGY